MLQLLYKSPCSVWCNRVFMSCLAVVIALYPEFVYQFVIVLCCQVYASLSIFSVLCPCPLCKKVIVIKALTKDIHTLYHVSLYRYRLFTSYSTHRNCINLFIVLISICFTSLSLITKKVSF